MPEKISTKTSNNLFANKNFVLLLLINIVVIFSDKSLLMIKNVLSLSTIVISILPYIFFAPLAGYLADKYNKKDILVKSILVKLAIPLFLILFIFILFSTFAYSHTLSRLTEYVSIFCSFFFLVSIVFINIITLSLIPNIVQKYNLRSANSLLLGFNILIGALIHRAFVEQESLSLFIAIFSILIGSVISLILAKFINLKEENQSLQEDLPESKTTFIESFKSTIAYLKTHQKTKRTIELACALSLLTSVFYIALIALAQDKLNTLLTMIGSGMLIGVIGINFLQNKFKLNDLLTFSFIILVIAFGTAQFVNSSEMAWFWLIPIGAANIIINTLIETAIQKTVPNRFRGKIFGFKAFITNLVFVVCLVIISQFVLVKIPPIKLIHGLAWFAFSITLIILFF